MTQFIWASRPRQSIKTLVVSAVATLFLSQISLAQDSIQTRKGLMKTVGASMKVSGAMAKGQMPYDPVKAELAMRAMAAVGLGIGQYFPDNSKTGGETTASPKIWEDMNGFKAGLAKFAADANAGVQAAKSGEAAWKAAFGKVASNCKSCHQSYRVKKN